MKQNSGSNNVIKDIQRRLSKGETRETIAVAMGYKNYRSLHTYMTRKGYTWDPHQGNYISGMQKIEKSPPYTSPSLFDEKAERIISLFEQGIDAKHIAKRLGFPRYLEMAAYMSEKGYRWDPIQQNYIPEQPTAEEKKPIVKEKEKIIDHGHNLGQPVPSLITLIGSLNTYIGAIQWLIANQHKIESLINSEIGPREIKYYQIPGKMITTTIQAPKPLVKLAGKFSEENGMQDIELVQAAVVEYLKAHGYEKEVSTLMN